MKRPTWWNVTFPKSGSSEATEIKVRMDRVPVSKAPARTQCVANVDGGAVADGHDLCCSGLRVGYSKSDSGYLRALRPHGHGKQKGKCEQQVVIRAFAVVVVVVESAQSGLTREAEKVLAQRELRRLI